MTSGDCSDTIQRPLKRSHGHATALHSSNSLSLGTPLQRHMKTVFPTFVSLLFLLKDVSSMNIKKNNCVSSLFPWWYLTTFVGAQNNLHYSMCITTLLVMSDVKPIYFLQAPKWIKQCLGGGMYQHQARMHKLLSLGPVWRWCLTETYALTWIAYICLPQQQLLALPTSTHLSKVRLLETGTNLPHVHHLVLYLLSIIK